MTLVIFIIFHLFFFIEYYNTVYNTVLKQSCFKIFIIFLSPKNLNFEFNSQVLEKNQNGLFVHSYFFLYSSNNSLFVDLLRFFKFKTFKTQLYFYSMWLHDQRTLISFCVGHFNVNAILYTSIQLKLKKCTKSYPIKVY